MTYRHDIFVSYRRDPETLRWIRDHFLTVLKQRVDLELEYGIDIYVHEVTDQIQAGTAWPADLGETIAHSRILIALWSGNYLASEWCCQELTLMLEREKKAKARTAANKYGLVIPILVHDGEQLPVALESAQRLDLKECFNSRMPQNGVKAELLADRIATHAQGIAAAIRAAPKWRKDWPRKSAQKLLKAYRIQQKSQTELPRYSRR